MRPVREVTGMDGPDLSGRERRILAMIESELRADVELDRQLSQMRPPRRRPVAGFLAMAGRMPTGLVVLLLVSTLGLTVLVVQIRTVVAFALLGLSWALLFTVLVARAAADRTGH